MAQRVSKAGTSRKKPAAFGSQSHRFETRGVGHPTTKRPGTCIADTYRIPNGQSTSWPSKTKSQLKDAGGSHDFDHKRAFGEVKTYRWQEKSMRRHKKQEASTRGPGFYDVTGKLPYEDRRLHTAVDHPGARMPNEVPGSSMPAVVKDRLRTPGPGAYGSDGVPEHQKNYTGGNRSHTRKGPLDSAPRRPAKKDGTSLPPGHYHSEHAVTKPNTGKRGMYDLNSGKRLVTMPRYITEKMATEVHLGPGVYGTAPAKSKQEHLDFVKAKARFSPDRPDNRDFHQEIKKASQTQAKAPFGANANTRAATERFTRAASHDVGANQYTSNRGWASGRQGGGSNYVSKATAKYSRTYASAVGGAEPRFDDRTPSIGLLQERLRPRHAGRNPELNLTAPAHAGSTTARIPLAL